MQVKTRTKVYTQREIVAGPIASLDDLAEVVRAIQLEHPEATGVPSLTSNNTVALCYATEDSEALRALLLRLTECCYGDLKRQTDEWLEKLNG